MHELDTGTIQETYRAYVQTGKSIRKTATLLGIARSTLQNRLKRYEEKFGDYSKPVAAGEVHGFQTREFKLPKREKILRYIITSAQSNTYVHEAFWNNLKAYAGYHDAEILIAQFSYNKAAYGKKSVKPGTEPTVDDLDGLWFDSALDGYFCNDRIRLAPTLTFCGEQNIMPTAVLPLSGFESYPGNHSSAIFPHAKIAMDSIAAVKGQDVKFNYTTGAVTLRNYIQKKAGLRAEFDHAYGALIIEVNSDGDWWVRQINGKEDGSFYDLDVWVHEAQVTAEHPVEAIGWGDIHYEVIDPEVEYINWGSGGILDTLRPHYQFMHDTIDFYARNHHRISNPHARFDRWLNNRSNVKNEFQRVYKFLNETSYRVWCETIIVDSNHDNAMERWLREGDYKTDEQNAVFFLECQLEKYRAMERGDPRFHMVEAILKGMGIDNSIKFLRNDESFIICGDDGIECGMHGHLGPNGAKPSPASFAKLGRRSNTGHTHTAKIIHGTYVGGTCSKLKLEYNAGPSSWSWSHVITYANGKRCIITLKSGKWKA